MAMVCSTWTSQSTVDAVPAAAAAAVSLFLSYVDYVDVMTNRPSFASPNPNANY
jgi:hypothetical protein